MSKAILLNKHSMKVLPFWSGPFSQWSESYFRLGGIEFNCAEQAMMYGKALFFNDIDIARQVMIVWSPADQKALGRKVSNFDFGKWEDVCCDLVTAISYAKYTQNYEFLQHLIDSKDDWIVEASPRDKVWGVGLGPDDPKVLDPKNWNGKNYLGECIMNAREIIFNPSVENAEVLGDIIHTVETIFSNFGKAADEHT